MEKITNFYEFVQWCFRSEDAGFMSLIVICAIFSGIIGIIKVLKTKNN